MKRCPLAKPGWRYIEKTTLEAFTAVDWALLDAQRKDYQAEHQANQVLQLLSASADAPTFGYQINNFQHCLQSATLALRAGEDEETIVMCLLHDIGFVVCPDTHAQFAGMLLGPYLSERNHWALLHHPLFQQYHIHEHPTLKRNARERWRGHPHFAWATTFVERYDICAIDPDYETAPLAAFAPMVQRFFARPPRSLAPGDSP